MRINKTDEKNYENIVRNPEKSHTANNAPIKDNVHNDISHTKVL